MIRTPTIQKIFRSGWFVVSPDFSIKLSFENSNNPNAQNSKTHLNQSVCSALWTISIVSFCLNSLLGFYWIWKWKKKSSLNETQYQTLGLTFLDTRRSIFLILVILEVRFCICWLMLKFSTSYNSFLWWIHRENRSRLLWKNPVPLQKLEKGKTTKNINLTYQEVSFLHQKNYNNLQQI